MGLGSSYCSKSLFHVNLPKEVRQSLTKAIKQVEKIKSLSRSPVGLQKSIDPYLTLGDLHGSRPNWPEIHNPLFGAVFARHVRVKHGQKPLESGAKIRNLLNGRKFHSKHSTDLIVAGEDVVLLPFIKNNSDNRYHSPFFIEKKSHLSCYEKEKLAFAIGICSLLYALDTIRLGKCPDQS